MLESIESVRADLSLPAENFIVFGRAARHPGYVAYEDMLARASDGAPSRESRRRAIPWTLMYTSGTTGKPKGAIRSHRGGAMLSLVTDVELGCRARDSALLVMPMCHANSLYFFGAFAYCGAACTIYSRKSFDPEHLVRTLADGRRDLHLAGADALHHDARPLRRVRARHNVIGRHQADDLVGAGAARHQAGDHGLLQEFRPVRALRLDRSRMGHHASSGRAVHQARLGRPRMHRLAADPPARCGRQRRGRRRAGELYSCNAYTFDGYWKLPEKTSEAFRGDYCTVGDMARRDEDGYVYLVDRKSNMIISGGENVYPSEVESLFGAHPKVKDVAVIGVADDKWGERVHAVIVAHDGEAPTQDEILDWCRNRIAGYKRPRSMSFIRGSPTCRGPRRERSCTAFCERDLTPGVRNNMRGGSRAGAGGEDEVNEAAAKTPKTQKTQKTRT